MSNFTIRPSGEIAKSFKGHQINIDRDIVLQSINENTHIMFCAQPDPDTNIDHHFGVECGWSRQRVAGLKKRIENGNLTHFNAKVYVQQDGEELGSAYLGSCFYKDLSEFFKDGYLPQMMEEALEESDITH